MNFKSKFFIKILSFIAVAGISSCTSSSDPSYFYGPIYEFGDVKSIEGDAVTYTVEKFNSNATVTVTSLEPSLVDPEEYPVGTRVLLKYNITSDLPTSSQTTNIQLTEIHKAHTPSITTAPTQSCATGNIKITPAENPYRAGRHLNIRANVVKGTYVYSCQADEATLSTSTPHIYVSVTEPGSAASTEHKSRATEYSVCPISVDLNPIWDNLAGKTCVVHLNTGSDKGDTTYRISVANK